MPVSSGNPHFHKHDYVHSLLHTCLSSDMQQLSRLLLNLGPHDKSSNFLLEQRSLNRAQAQENLPIRNLINQEVSYPFQSLCLTTLSLLSNYNILAILKSKFC